MAMAWLAAYAVSVLAASMLLLSSNTNSRAIIHSAAGCELTLVTAYFEVPSKHSRADYHRWMGNSLSLDACMVVHMDVSSPLHVPSRGLAPTLWKLTRLDRVALRLNRTLQFWEAQHAKDPEAWIHRGYHLYWVWALKGLLLQDAAQQNPFSSQYFFWMDVGCMRDAQHNGKSLRLVPPPVHRCPHAVFFAMVAPFTQQELLRSSREGPSIVADRLSGAIWGGTADAVASFGTVYWKTFDRLASEGYFVGKDQDIMNTACVEHPGLCMGVRSSLQARGEWFFMLPFLLREASQAVVAPI
jgi:hypothetical protein